MLDKLKALMDMQKKMQDVKKELDNIDFEVLSSDGLVKLTMNGSQELKQVKITVGLAGLEVNNLESSLKDAWNRAIKRSHELAALKMKDVTGFNLPGLT
ncbi:MAG: YbaB/EbfC family nucleoid-associated protein [Candidatus Omnitrophica bacterium]|nr:YbaB/EbfC family nucleoid-associated protein [Candidatus Omnitrophota bacterium]MBU1928415.1 YbaB/EbfC family nucleoid-associated protein [Candidatus Omnitrophota bacterium]MBU2034297.1 YbaB/EbfC family nucleoid-associated protein [Candidatus Omnitrophota bacterium]